MGSRSHVFYEKSERKIPHHNTNVTDRDLVQWLIRIWCNHHGIDPVDLKPGSADHPGPFLRFLKAATDPLKGKHPFTYVALREKAREFKEEAK